jgi:hypothetical protein
MNARDELGISLHFLSVADERSPCSSCLAI